MDDLSFLKMKLFITGSRSNSSRFLSVMFAPGRVCAPRSSIRVYVSNTHTNAPVGPKLYGEIHFWIV